jgi:hypothetical protein
MHRSFTSLIDWLTSCVSFISLLKSFYGLPVLSVPGVPVFSVFLVDFPQFYPIRLVEIHR